VASLANNRLDWETLPGTNSSLFGQFLNHGGKMFHKIAPWVGFILFFVTDAGTE
jgi:hypothetical protein